MLFVTEQSYTYDTGIEAALYCQVYYSIDGSVKDLGSVESEGTAYPVSYGQGCIYTAGNHSVSKYVIDETTYQLICEQKDEVSYDAWRFGIRAEKDKWHIFRIVFFEEIHRNVIWKNTTYIRNS